MFACLHVLCTAWGTVSPPASPRPAMGAGGCSGWSPPLRAMQGRGSAQSGTGERAPGFPFGAPSSCPRISQSPFPLQHPHRKERAGSSQKCSAEEKETETRPSTNVEPHAHPSLAPTPVAQRSQPGRAFVPPHREHASRWVRASGLRAMNRFRSPGRIPALFPLWCLRFAAWELRRPAACCLLSSGPASLLLWRRCPGRHRECAPGDRGVWPGQEAADRRLHCACGGGGGTACAWRGLVWRARSPLTLPP